jgi:ribosomal protein L3
LLEGVSIVDVTGTAKGKGFQGMVKKFHVKGG